MLTAEEQLDYDSFALASPGVTRASLWKFAEETSSGSQTQPQAQTITFQARPVTGTTAKPSGSQTQTQAPAQARPQAPAQAQPQAQQPQPAQDYFLSHRPLPPWGLKACLQTLHMMKIGSLWISQGVRHLQ